MFTYFLALCPSVLQPTEDPLKMLGVSRDTNNEGIKVGYNGLTEKLEPNPPKDKDSTKVDESFEILTNDKKKRSHDNQALLRDEKTPRRERYQKMVPRLMRRGFGDFFFHGFNSHPVAYRTPLLSSHSLDGVLGMGDACFVFIFSENETKYTPDYGRSFEYVAEHFKNYSRFLRVSAEQGGVDFMSKYRIKIKPCVAYFTNKKGEIRIGKIIRTTDNYALRRWVEDCFPHHILVLGDLEEAELWVKSNPHITHVISFGAEEGVPYNLRQISCLYPTIHFAYLRNETRLDRGRWNFTIYPTTLIFRGGVSVEMNNETKIEQFAPYYCTPFIWMLLYFDVEFYLYCGNRMPRHNFTENTAISAPSSFFSKFIHIKEGQWCFINSSESSMRIVSENGINLSERIKLPSASSIIAALSSIRVMITNRQIIWSIVIIWLGFFLRNVCTDP